MADRSGWRRIERTDGRESAKRSFERNYRESYSFVYNYIFRRVADRTVAEDVTSEAYLRAARFYDRFDPERAKFSTWVISIAHNCIIDYYRHAPATADLEEIPEGAYAEEDSFAEQAGNSDLAAKLLSALDETERVLVAKKYFECKRNTEIAEELGMNLSTVSTKLSRAVAKMRSVAEGSTI